MLYRKLSITEILRFSYKTVKNKQSKKIYDIIQLIMVYYYKGRHKILYLVKKYGKIKEARKTRGELKYE